MYIKLKKSLKTKLERHCEGGTTEAISLVDRLLRCLPVPFRRALAMTDSMDFKGVL